MTKTASCSVTDKAVFVGKIEALLRNNLFVDFLFGGEFSSFVELSNGSELQ